MLYANVVKSFPFVIAALITCATSVAQGETPRAPQAGPAPVSGEQQSTVAYGHAVERDEQPSRHWYGWQTLATDGAALGVLALGLGAAADNQDVVRDVALVGWLGTYALGGPIVHAAHGRAGAALGSLGLRLAAPLTFAVISNSTADCDGWDDGRGHSCNGSELVPGLLIGMATAIVLDAAVLAHERVPPRESSALRVGTVRINASLGHSRNESKLVVSGSF